jgi:hypothetical protein
MERRGVNVIYCACAEKYTGTQIRQVGILQPLARGQVSFFIISVTAVTMHTACLRRKDLMKSFPSMYTNSGLTLMTIYQKRVT